jgi:hypothetical protein
LEQKLQQVAKCENIDNYALCMMDDKYGYGFIYAISTLVLGAIKLQERMCELTKNQKPAEAYSV